MITKKYIKYSYLLIAILFCFETKAISDCKEEGVIYGNLKLDSSWDSKIYLVYIPTFEEMYLLSNKAIIASSIIDSLGNFMFDISFLPKDYNVFRLQVVKKGDSPNSLIIGGRDENHMFIIANNKSVIAISNRSSYPFSDIDICKSTSNVMFNDITKMIAESDSVIGQTNNYRANLHEKRFNDKLRNMADTCQDPLISLYLLYNTNFRLNYQSKVKFYRKYLLKWEDQDNPYFDSFREQIALPLPSNKKTFFFVILISIVLVCLSFYLGTFTKRTSVGIQKLSVQERKIFELLQKGATNQDISEKCNIGISTVKTHVRNIFAKLKVKSRKEILNMS